MYDSAESKALAEKNKKESNIRFATVTSLENETNYPMLTFYGEDTESKKKYNFLASYKPVLNDVVLLLKTDDSYIIAGSITNVIDEENEQEEFYKNLVSALNKRGIDISRENYNADIGSAKISALDVYDFNILSTGKLEHRGKLGFFGAKPVSKSTGSINQIGPDISYSAGQDLSDDVVQKAIIKRINWIASNVNAIGTVLDRYGLFNYYTY